MGSMWRRLAGAAAAAMVAAAVGCTLKDQAKPDFVGPSELGLSLELTANPDVLYWDGASQSLIAIQARNDLGQPAANVAATVQVMTLDRSGQRVFYDLGTISARSIVTGSDGRASVRYTAPLLDNDTGEIPVWIVVTPSQANAASQVPREVQIRLLPPGVILPPVDLKPDFTFSPAQPVAGQDVVFDASRSTGSIAGYQWNFGDGTTGSGAIVTHRYTTEGGMSVRLTVTDTLGRSASVTKAVTVGASADPKADFEFSPTAPVAGQTIYFTAAKSTAAPGRRIASYDWDFGSGRTASGMTVEKVYDTPATYKVTLTVTDDVGRKGVTSKDVTVAAKSGALAADFTFSPTAPAVGQTVFFNAGSSTTPAGTTITSYAWDFGDGSTGTGATPTHVFTAAGTYVVRLTITNSAGQTATTTKEVPVAAGLTATFTVSPTSGTVGAVINVNASASTAPPGRTIVSYTWNFGCTAPGQCSAATGSGVTSSTTYNAAGTYTITLTVTDDLGNTATATKTVAIS